MREKIKNVFGRNRIKQTHNSRARAGLQPWLKHYLEREDPSSAGAARVLAHHPALVVLVRALAHHLRHQVHHQPSPLALQVGVVNESSKKTIFLAVFTIVYKKYLLNNGSFSCYKQIILTVLNINSCDVHRKTENVYFTYLKFSSEFFSLYWGDLSI